MVEIPDEENLKDVVKQDSFMKEVYKKELGDNFESYTNGVCTGMVDKEAMEEAISKISVLVDNSPCVGVCYYNAYNYCIGCKRHELEVIDWYDFSKEKKAGILKDLETRRVDV